MYGWEFPPKISGGLGVACHAIVTELLKKQIKMTLVLPYTLASNDMKHLNLVNGGKPDPTAIQDQKPQLEVRYSKTTTGLNPYVKNLPGQQSKESIRAFIKLIAKLALPDEIKTLAKEAVMDEQWKVMDDNYEVNLITEVFRYAVTASTWAAKVKHDVIHAHDWLTILAALEAKTISGKPVVLHIHALETDRSGFWVDKRIFAIEKFGMQHADQIIAVSQYTKNNIVRHYGISPNKISVVHNGVYSNEANQFTTAERINKSHKMVLFLGRITHQKGPRFFIEIARKVLSKRPEVQFVMAGTGDSLHGIIERVAELGLGRNIHFTGFLNSSQVQVIYNLADVYVMPSVSEPFGLSALEALSSGVPAVISKQSGVAEVLNHTLAADFWDTDDMAAKILALLDYPILGNTSLAYTQSEIKSLTWEQSALKIIEIYQSVTRH